MATTAQQCNACRRTLIKMPGSQYEICPVCHTVNLFNQKIKGRVLFRIGQFFNAAVNQYQLDLQQPSYRGRKRAVLCGITYNGHKKKLEASVHNVRSMQQLLINKLGFPSASILVLTEEESDRSRIPTKRNIQAALQWLVRGCQPGDSLMFYYAGHATQIPDEDGDEIDGYDEALCPLDYRVAGSILDDEINATIVAPLPHGVTLHCVVDTCFSGTLLDLPFLCTINRDGLYKWEEHQLTNKGTRGGKAVCISACADDQISADTSVNHAQQVVSRFMPRASTMKQEPQLSSSTRFEIYSEPVKF
ncbi:hypothetical protein M8C21_009366 [Ambrosia artemisiifolia]|uniref:Peptidase C14 caspase domain-containing protein n=1 Tax=Ambrosia artemisiifolia TaxID=4212 RepID=A0AAD5CGY2_AMBAR|nr:hypothetical protein M8C21_009366 [Ambrosia artemisiifolia]